MSTLLPWHHPHAQVLTATMPDGIRGARHGGPVVGTMPDSIEEQLVQRWTGSRRVVVATIPYSLEQSSSGAVSNIAIFSIVLHALCLIITGSVMCIVINVRAYLMLNFFYLFNFNLNNCESELFNNVFSLLCCQPKS
jgi:hypothetical protein